MFVSAQSAVDLLVDVSLKAAFLACAVGAGLWILRIRNCNLRHRAWLAVLAAMLLLPALVHVAPQVALPEQMYPLLHSQAKPSVDVVKAAATPTSVPLAISSLQPDPQIEPFPVAPDQLTADNTTTGSPSSIHENPAKPASDTASAVSPIAPSTGATTDIPVSWPAFLLAGYVIGAALFGGRLLWAMVCLRRLVRSAQPMTLSPKLAQLTNSVDVRESSAVLVPLTAGGRRPTILLPSDWRAWDESLLTAALSHELAHIRRGDHWVTLAAEANRVVYWFHPVAWFLRRRLATLAEFSCDDAVIETLGDRAGYATHLLAVAGRLAGRNWRVQRTAVAMARTPQVESRIDAILDASRPLARRLGTRGALLLIAVVLPLVVVTAGLKAQTRSNNPAAKADPQTQPAAEAIATPAAPPPLIQGTITDDKAKSATETIELAAVQPADGRAARVDHYGDALPAGAAVRMGTVRLRHAQSVAGVAFSPDGKTLASCGLDNSIRFWDVATGRSVRSFHSPDNSWLFALAYSPDGSKLVCGSERGLVSAWDVTSGELIFKTQGHRDGINGMAFSPEGAVFATAGSDGVVHIWDATSGKSVLELFKSGRASDSCPIVFSPDGTLLAAANGEGSLIVWNLAKGGEPQVFSAPRGRGAMGLAFTADGNQLISGGTRSVPTGPRAVRSVAEIHLWSITDGGMLPGFATEDELPGDCMLAISADRSTLVSGHRDRIIVWDVASRQPRSIIRGFSDRLGGRTHGLAISPDGKLIASKSGNLGTHKINLWDATTGEPILAQNDTHGDSVLGSAFSPDGKLVATSGADHAVRLWNATTGEHLRKIDQASGWVRYVEFFPDGQRIVLGSETSSFEGELKICRVADGQVLHHFTAPDRVMCGALSADGKLLAAGIGLGSRGGRGRRGRAADEGGSRIIVWDTERGEQVAEMMAGMSLQLSFSPRGDELWSLSDDQQVRKWNPRTGEEMPLSTAAGGSGQYNRQAVLVPSSASLVSSILEFAGGAVLSRSSLLMRPLNSETPRWEKDLGGSWATTLAASPDGKILVTQLRATDGSTVDDRITLWALDDGRELMTFNTDDNSARSFAFSPDGGRLVSGMELGDALVWDISSALEK